MAARDAYLDNVKLVAIVLVVVAHAWTPYTPDSELAKTLYLFVFTFHMPAFIFVAGYFTRSWDGQPRRVKRLITRVLVPYLVFEAAYTLFFNTAGGRDEALSLLDPWWATWFVLALFLWRLSAPAWRVLRRPVPIAIAISLLASMQPLGPALDLDRVLQLLPFFVLGMAVRREHLDLLHRRAVRVVAAGVLAGALVVAGYASTRGMTEFFFWRSPRGHFDQLGFAQWLALRVGVLACAVAATAAFLALVPRRRSRLTALGEGTMYAYLLHGFVVKGAVFAGVHIGFAATTGAAALLALGLCSRPVRRVFRGVVEPDLRWLFRRPPPPLELDPSERRPALLGSNPSL
jgi:fucose 4-O-acetylase-like acetyltransferase